MNGDDLRTIGWTCVKSEEKMMSREGVAADSHARPVLPQP